MPVLKNTFARLGGFDAAQLQPTATRLRKIVFDINSEEQVLGIDVEGNRLSAEIAVRRQREVPVFNELKKALISEKRYEYRSLLFSLDAASGIISTAGARRDLTLFTELLKRSGAGGVELSDLKADLIAWSRAFLKLYDTAQLGQLVLDRFYAEPRLTGRFTAKTVDNRIDLKAVEEAPGHLKSIRFSFYHYDARRSVEARDDGVLSVSTSDDEDLGHFFAEMSKLYLKHAGAEK